MSERTMLFARRLTCRAPWISPGFRRFRDSSERADPDAGHTPCGLWLDVPPWGCTSIWIRGRASLLRAGQIGLHASETAIGHGASLHCSREGSRLGDAGPFGRCGIGDEVTRADVRFAQLLASRLACGLSRWVRFPLCSGAEPREDGFTLQYPEGAMPCAQRAVWPCCAVVLGY